MLALTAHNVQSPLLHWQAVIQQIQEYTCDNAQRMCTLLDLLRAVDADVNNLVNLYPLQFGCNDKILLAFKGPFKCSSCTTVYTERCRFESHRRTVPRGVAFFVRFFFLLRLGDHVDGHGKSESQREHESWEMRHATFGRDIAQKRSRWRRRKCELNPDETYISRLGI
ncbi:hypothetical protein B0H13DRAFT_1912021 [Mycena leptocephala]|nr:hypothetical protein B0H13DRAFT_1912021 [Mycena leptocephala]